VAIKAGSILHVGNDTVVIDRIQTAGPGNLNIPTEKIYELGNYESVATIRDIPDLSFTLESFDTSTEVEALLLGVPTTTNEYDLAKARAVDIASQFKAGKDAVAPFDVVNSVGLPYLTCESASYRFGLRDNARQTFGLRGDAIFYNPGSTYVDEVAGTATANQVVTSSHPAYQYSDANGTRRALAVVVGNRRLTPVVDYTEVDVAAGTGVTYPAGSSTFSVTIKAAVPTTDKIRVMFASPDTRVYNQTVHEGTAVKPAAVRGKDIDIYVGGYNPADIPGSAANKWASVQSANVDWRVTLERDEEFGNYYAVAQDFDVPTVNGSLDIKPRDTTELFAKIRQITGVTDPTRVVGPNTADPLPLDIVIKDGANNGAVLKRLHVPDARFTVPGFTGRVQTKLTVSLNFESDGGKLLVYKA
jgi:hypothetical protein